MKTKFSKTFTTYFFPVGEESGRLWRIGCGFCGKRSCGAMTIRCFRQRASRSGSTRQFEAAGLERKHWSTATPIRTIFREAFERAGLPYFHPHSLRKTLARLGEQVCKSPEDFKAWSQNLGHEQVLTTFLSYGSVATDRQGEIIRGLAIPKAGGSIRCRQHLLRTCSRRLRDSGTDSRSAV